MQLASNGYRCELTPPPAPTPDKKGHDAGHGGEVALGLLFAISFVAAAAGWFLIWRWKKSGSLESVGLLQNRS